MDSTSAKTTKKRYKSRLTIALMTQAIALGFFFFGYCLVYLGSIPIATILTVFHSNISSGIAQGLLNGCIPVGGFLGAMFSSILIKRLSRRKCLLLVDGIAIVVGGLTFIPNFYTLIASRLVQGFCVGLFSSVCSLVVKQLAPTEIGGSLGAFLELNLCAGNLVAFLANYCCKKITGDLTCQAFWPVMFGIPFVGLAIQAVVLLMVFPFETPKYLLLQGDELGARKMIELIYLPQFVEEVLVEKKKDIQHILSKQNSQDIADSSDELEGSLLSQSSEEKEERKQSSNRAGTIMGIHLSVMQQFSGINAINIYCNPIVDKATSGELALLMSSLVNLEKLIAVSTSSLLLAHFGRKTLLQLGLAVACAACTMSAIGFYLQDDYFDMSEKLIVVGLFLFMGNFGLSLGPIVWLSVPEIVQPRMVPFATAANWISSSLIIILFPIFTDHLLEGDPAPLLLVFAAYCLGSWIVNHVFLLETKNKTEKQIREEYALSKLN